ncbi:MarC family protein [Candidatus Woesearchaeota archaeon]|nr:MarC family protein [Candidatus Woesearchaeota archaeon]
MIEDLIKAFITIIVIIDPLGILPTFLSLTKNKSNEKIQKSANKTIFVSSVIILLFIFLGPYILKFFNISLPSFKVAGGLVMLVMGVTYVLDIKIGSTEKYSEDITVPMATPIVAGPGTLSTVMILVPYYGYLITFISAMFALFLTWLSLSLARLIKKHIGEQGMETISRLMGLIVTAIAIEFIISGAMELIKSLL